MSSDLAISFAPDMPAASVEVVAPDLQVVARVMLEAGRSQTVRVPSEASFLRVHLPSGQTATLQEPGRLKRVVSMQSIREQMPAAHPPDSRNPQLERFEDDEEAPTDLASLKDLTRYHVLRSVTGIGADIFTDAFSKEAQGATRLPLSCFGDAQLLGPNGMEVAGVSTRDGQEAHWQMSGDPEMPPLGLTIEREGVAVLQVRIPAAAQRIWARADFVRQEDRLAFSVRIATSEPVADAIIGYLQRGDLYSAESMTSWVNEAEQVLLHKKRNPYAAAVGAYLLLRLKRFDQLHDWPKNLADWFPFLPDGCVIWAWQLIHQRPEQETEIRAYLLEAASRGLPVYTEGLRLLLDGLRLLGKEGASAREELLDRLGVVLWNSPLTATLHGDQRAPAIPIGEKGPVVFDIAFAADA